MSQISPPIRIVLVLAVAFMAAWFVLLRPSAEPVTPTQPAAAPVETTAANGTAPAAATTTTGGAVAPAGAAPAAKPADAELALPGSVAKAVAQKKTLVMLFWNKNAFDDQAVRRELRAIDRHKGKVQIHVASIEDVSRYAPITRGVNLEQSPTIVVTRGGTADALVGYVDRGTINQTVSDVMRSTAAKKK